MSDYWEKKHEQLFSTMLTMRAQLTRADAREELLTAQVKKLRVALTQVKVDHLNKKVSLPLQTHALVENALNVTKPEPT
jgi:hypothetical protein